MLKYRFQSSRFTFLIGPISALVLTLPRQTHYI